MAGDFPARLCDFAERLWLATFADLCDYGAAAELPGEVRRLFLSLRAGSRRPAGTDRAGAGAAGETVQQIGPGPVNLPGPVLVEQIGPGIFLPF